MKRPVLLAVLPLDLVRNSGAEILSGNKPAGTKRAKGVGTDYSADLILAETLNFIEAKRNRLFIRFAASYRDKVQRIEAIMARELVPSPHHNAPEKSVARTKGKKKKK